MILILQKLFYDRIGIYWNNKNLISCKDWLNNKILALFQKHANSSHDEFVKDFKIIFLVIFFVALISFYISSKYFSKDSIQGAATIWGMAYFLFFGFITKERFKTLFDLIIKDITKFLHRSINIVVILMAAALTLGAIISPNEVVELFLNPSNLTLVLSITAMALLVNTLGISLIFLVPYFVVAVFAILFRELVIKPTLKISPNKPLLILSDIISIGKYVAGYIAIKKFLG